MGKSGGSSSQSSSRNPAWLDKAGEEVYGFAKDILFKPAGSSTRSSGTLNSSSSAGGVTPFAGGNKSMYNEWVANNPGYDPATGLPKGGMAGKSASSSGSTAGGSGAMTMDNLRPLEQYTGKRLADLHENQWKAAGTAKRALGALDGYFDDARGLIGGATGSFGQTFNNNAVNPMMTSTGMFTQDDMNRYMNPFIKGALDPAASELQRTADIERNRLNLAAGTRGSFGGSRNALQESELSRNLLDSTNKLYGEGYASGFDKAVAAYLQEQQRKLQSDTANQSAKLTADTFNEDMRFKGFESSRNQFNQEADRKINAAGALGNLATMKSNITSQDIERLLRTGTLLQQQEQLGLDQNVADFLERRDYGKNQLSWLNSIIGSSPSQGAITTTTTQKPNPLAQIAGLGLTAAGVAGGLGWAPFAAGGG